VYAEAEANIPVIEQKPAFKISGGNNTGTFPVPPESGKEQSFCQGQGSDAFMSGRIIEYHGRLYLSLKVYSLYSRSWTFEDAVIFSMEDLTSAVEELSSRLVAAIEGTPPSAVVITARQENAIISINNEFAGRGKTAILERAPGEVEIIVAADDYVPEKLTVDLASGELSDISINLTPFSNNTFRLDIPGNTDSLVYQGALYIGKTPIILTAPRNSYEYITIETPTGDVGSTIVPQGMRGDLINIPMKVGPPPKEGRVDKARRGFYGAWGRFWIALPLMLMTNGVANTMIDSFNRNQDPTMDQYDTALAYQYVSYGITGVTVGFAAESVIRIFTYLYGSSKGEPTLNRKLRTAD
jgi:hypothetical protein